VILLGSISLVNIFFRVMTPCYKFSTIAGKQQIVGIKMKYASKKIASGSCFMWAQYAFFQGILAPALAPPSEPVTFSGNAFTMAVDAPVSLEAGLSSGTVTVQARYN
jgi:hypothetical protein